ncbi:type IV pilus modification PilV family protein [Actomonas aquatica]|uniref:Prepilin-type N-terminal cleavage/methylation domain-containing protein n=1 Tax=Actomonas aquatica TaxID=2866162 RepID=A0ABZ1C9W9_9BACT|nr:hypothetical protein [Opitutus sp. WL0086]WRQ88175.1 hypothetical protein K1X11_002065 [Opitutus sp. WL0086]
MTLIEVMVAAGILAVVATTMVGIFLQNQRFSYFLGYRSQAITTSLSILEQLRFRQYAEIADVYNAGAAGSVTVSLADPAEADGYRDVIIPVNIRDNTELSPNWTTANITVDPDSNTKLPMKFFLMLKRNYSNSGTKMDVFEVILLFKWRRSAENNDEWETSNVRLVVPNLNPI